MEREQNSENKQDGSQSPIDPQSPIDQELAAAYEEARLDDLEEIQFVEHLRRSIQGTETGALLEQLNALYQHDLVHLGISEAELPGTVWIREMSERHPHASELEQEARVSGQEREMDVSERGEGEGESARGGDLSERQQRELADAILGSLLGRRPGA